jgi:hypothetical protein
MILISNISQSNLFRKLETKKALKIKRKNLEIEEKKFFLNLIEKEF